MHWERKPVFSVVGLGKLGLTMLACFAGKGYQTYGLDVDPAKMDALFQQKNYLVEPGLDELLEANWDQIIPSTDWEETIGQSDVTFIVVPTPAEPSGNFSIQYVLEAMKSIGPVLAKKDGYHLIVVTSTVLPGAMDKEILPTLEKASGKKVVEDFGLCYNPEFIALGTVIRDFQNPDMILIGESDTNAGDLLEAIYHKVCDNDPIFRRMNFVNAELTKISINTFITMKISFANLIARMAENLDGGDADTVTGAVGMDSRIGIKYLKGSMGYGGPCFPRDNIALAYVAENLKVPPILPTATDRFNRLQVEMVADLVKKHAKAGGKIGVLGLSYKPGSDVIEEAQALQVAQQLAKDGFEVFAHDPMALEPSKQATKLDNLTFVDDPIDCLKSVDVTLLATPWGDYKGLDGRPLPSEQRPPVIIDAWGILNADFFPETEILYLGRSGK